MAIKKFDDSSFVDLSGLSKKSPLRIPSYVHDPEVIRGLIKVLGKHDEKSRQALFKQANHLMYASEDRIRKCLEYSDDPIMNWSVIYYAMNSIINMVNISLLHPNDRDLIREAFRLLRAYTFEIPIEKLDFYLNNEIKPNNKVSNFILEIAKKINNGITPKYEYGWCHLKQNIIDDWLDSAEKNPIS